MKHGILVVQTDALPGCEDQSNDVHISEILTREGFMLG